MDKQVTVRIITFGTFDCFHIGHLRILERAKSLGHYLVVGVSTDQLNLRKGKKAIYSDKVRLEIVKNIKCVDQVFYEESLEEKAEYIKQYKADILVMGDDWAGVFDNMPCQVVYFPRTPDISTTLLKSIQADRLKLTIPLYNYTYVVPSLEILSKIAELRFMFICDLDSSQRDPMQIQTDCLYYSSLKQLVTSHPQYVPLKKCRQLLPGTKYSHSCIGSLVPGTTFGHGVDEEDVITALVAGNLTPGENIGTINPELIKFHSTIVNEEFNTMLFNQIYKIDNNKPTIVFCDGYNLPFLQCYEDSYQSGVCKQILETLIKLKATHNVVLRFHPFQEIGFKVGHQYDDLLTDNFIVDFTPFNNFFIFKKADILISTRYTSSGYQSLLANNTKIIFIDFDYDSRRKFMRNVPRYLKTITNQNFNQWQTEGTILSNREITVLTETDLSSLYSLIIEDRIHFSKEDVEAYLLRRFGDQYKVLRDHSQNFDLENFVRASFEWDLANK